MKILFVCTGNICRSPMAEVIFRNLCEAHGKKDVFISGAGTLAIEGMPITKEAIEALKKCGEKINREMTATRFKKETIKEYDLIITMTASHAQIIGHGYSNVKTLDEYTGCGDIFDPYMHSIETYVEVCKVLQESLNMLYNILFKG